MSSNTMHARNASKKFWRGSISHLLNLFYMIKFMFFFAPDQELQKKSSKAFWLWILYSCTINIGQCCCDPEVVAKSVKANICRLNCPLTAVGVGPSSWWKLSFSTYSSPSIITHMSSTSMHASNASKSFDVAQFPTCCILCWNHSKRSKQMQEG